MKIMIGFEGEEVKRCDRESLGAKGVIVKSESCSVWIVGDLQHGFVWRIVCLFNGAVLFGGLNDCSMEREQTLGDACAKITLVLNTLCLCAM